MFTERTSVGLDVHARSVAAAAIDGVTGELLQTKLTPSYDHVRSWVRDLPGPVAVVYEAGPTGFGLYRALTAAGIRCEVAAPSKLQKPAGDRVKTDAKDAVHLARLLRLDEITPVAIPTVDQEAARDLVRSREDARGDLMRARHRLSKLLLRHGSSTTAARPGPGSTMRGCGSNALGPEPPSWRSTPTTRPCAPWWHAETGSTRRSSRWRPTPSSPRSFGDLGCLRGIGTLTAFGLAVEIGDWHRFTGNTIGSFVGLVPTEHSSGASRVQGSITKTGNTHARRLLVEAAWHHRPRYSVGKTMRDRWDLAPTAARVRGDEGNRRLHARWVRFSDRRKRPVIANVAIARELAGWCWSLAVLDD